MTEERKASAVSDAIQNCFTLLILFLLIVLCAGSPDILDGLIEIVNKRVCK